MLNKLRLQNFKGWKDTTEIEMSPITLFFGTNSSGKSSIGQFLMMLKQTVESPDRKAVFNPGGTNSAVQLGSFQEMVYQRETKNNIQFDYEWKLSRQLKFKDALTGKHYATDRLAFHGQVSSDDTQDGMLFVDKLTYLLKDQAYGDIVIGMARQTDKKSKYKVDVDNYPLKRSQGRAWDPKTPVRFYGFPDEVIAYHQNAEFVQELNLEHENLFKAIYYLGPLRTRTDRLYPWGGITPESVGYSGQNTVAAMLASRERTLNLGFKRPQKPLEQIIAASLKSMGLIEAFEVNKISEQRHEYEVKIRTKGSKDWVDLPDVGFGISQVLPVLVQCFYAPRNSIIIMEQPEIHLHPSAQAALADVMIDVIDSGNDIYDEYRHKLSMSGRPGVGDKFMKWVHDNRHSLPDVDRVAIKKNDYSYDEFPDHPGLKQFDSSDRKFIAVSNAHPEKPPILQSTDSKWWGWKEALAETGITVQFLCPDYAQKKCREKIKK